MTTSVVASATSAPAPLLDSPNLKGTSSPNQLLPVELLARILEVQCRTIRDRREAMLSASLVCSNWTGIAQEILWREIELGTRTSIVAMEASDVCGLYRTRRVVVELRAVDLGAASDSLYRLFTRLYGMERLSLKMEEASMRSLNDAITVDFLALESFAGLKHLELLSGIKLNCEPAPLLVSFHATSISFGKHFFHPRFSRSLLLSPPPPSSQITSFSLSLGVNSYLLDNLSSLPSIAPSLLHFSIQSFVPLHPLLSTFSQLFSLESLALDIGEDPTRALDKILEVLPSRLRYLLLGASMPYGWQIETVKRYMGKEVLGGLRRLGLRKGPGFLQAEGAAGELLEVCERKGTVVQCGVDFESEAGSWWKRPAELVARRDGQSGAVLLALAGMTIG